MNRLLHTLGAAAGIAVVPAFLFVALVGAGGFGPWIEFRGSEAQVRRALDTLYAEAPYLAELAAHAPEAHARMVRLVTRDLELGLDESVISTDAQKVFDQWRAVALPDASDRVLVAYLELATERLRALRDVDPALCAAITLGRATDAPLPDLGERLAQREMHINRMLLRAGADEPVTRMTRAEIDAISRAIFAGLLDSHGPDAALLYAEHETTPEEDAVICRLGIATMQAIAALGPDRTPAAVRGMFFH